MLFFREAVGNEPTEEEPALPAHNTTSLDSSQVKEATDPESADQETRKRCSIFKERTIRPLSFTDPGENVTFKKRKLKNNKSTRKRCDED